MSDETCSPVPVITKNVATHEKEHRNIVGPLSFPRSPECLLVCCLGFDIQHVAPGVQRARSGKDDYDDHLPCSHSGRVHTKSGTAVKRQKVSRFILDGSRPGPARPMVQLRPPLTVQRYSRAQAQANSRCG